MLEVFVVIARPLEIEATLLSVHPTYDLAAAARKRRGMTGSEWHISDIQIEEVSFET